MSEDDFEIHVREATPEDDTAVGELLVDAFVTAYADKMPEVVVTEGRKARLRDVAEKRAQACVLVAELGGKIIGTVALYRPGAPDTEAWVPGAADLRHLALDSSLHGRGLSQLLLHAIERVAREWRVPTICLHVRRGAVGVARLYEKRGFTRAPEGDLDRLPEVFLEGYLKRLA